MYHINIPTLHDMSHSYYIYSGCTSKDGGVSVGATAAEARHHCSF